MMRCGPDATGIGICGVGGGTFTLAAACAPGPGGAVLAGNTRMRSKREVIDGDEASA